MNTVFAFVFALLGILNIVALFSRDKKWGINLIKACNWGVAITAGIYIAFHEMWLLLAISIALCVIAVIFKSNI